MLGAAGYLLDHVDLHVHFAALLSWGLRIDMFIRFPTIDFVIAVNHVSRSVEVDSWTYRLEGVGV